MLKARRSVLVLLLGVCIAGSAAAAEDPGWPRELAHPKADVVIYQPHLESMEGDRLRSRAAVSVALKDEGSPVFGVIWINARVLTDRDARTIELLETDVTDVRFPEESEEHKKRLAEFIEGEAESWDLVISLDRALASLAANHKEREISEDLKADAPVILYADNPAVLILIDGEPRFATIEEGKLKRVVNTPYTLVRDVKKKRYYLDGGVEWYAAADILGPWSVDAKPPKMVRALRSEKAERDARESIAGLEEYRPPSVIVATEPTELISSEGKAEYTPIPETELLYVSNTESDLLLHTGTQQHYVLLSGRWYISKSLDGPWSNLPSDRLPPDFKNIPADSAKGNVLVSVAGTPAADEALMDNQIPQTAAVKRGSAGVKVEYDGAPQFESIDGTEMEYALNTASSVLKIDGRYWFCEQAVWYVGENPAGPWQVADNRPDDINELPPSNPHYNTKYVYIYDSTPEVVYVGYTPGYVGSYPYGGSVVYGTGWYYPPWHGSYYYPHHSTWGFHVRYSPWYGWGVGVSWSNGPFTIAIGGIGYGGHHPFGGWWGPRGFIYAPVHHHHHYHGHASPAWNHPATRPARAAKTRPATTAALQPGAGRDNLYNRPGNKDRVADRGTARVQPAAAHDKANDVFAGKDGNVYKRAQDGNWQRREGDGWKASQPSGGVDRASSARQRGGQRASGFQGSRGSMGGARGSRGGRRR
jgi:hypothetical protein